jgi:hypothetical protein
MTFAHFGISPVVWEPWTASILPSRLPQIVDLCTLTTRRIFNCLVGAQYNFTAVDVGAYGRNSDGIFGNSNLGKALQRGTLLIA